MHSKVSPFNSSSSTSGYSELASMWEAEDDSSVSSFGSQYDVSKLEAYLYYYGIRGPNRQGPKLIFRTSQDAFVAPGSGEDPRPMQLQPVYEHCKLGKDNLWAFIRSKIVELIDQRNIQLSSIDLVRFSWVETNADTSNEDTEDLDASKDTEIDKKIKDIDSEIPTCRKVVTTPVTIWIGVLPDTLTGEEAFNSSSDILDLLKEYGISDIDIAFRESVVSAFRGPQLFAPVSELDALRAVIDPITTTLSLPISSLKNLGCQGTMGFYFQANGDLYGVTARHVLLPVHEGNVLYSYVAGPKKEVVLMGDQMFADFVASVYSKIGILISEVPHLKNRIASLEARLESNDPVTRDVVRQLELSRNQLDMIENAIEPLKEFYIKIKKQWTHPKDRVIGYVVWAPPISYFTDPCGYTKDVCVIKLDQKKFFPNFIGNVLDLGPEISPGMFTNKMYPRGDMPSEFKYPNGGLLKLRGILSAKEISVPNCLDHENNPVRYVIKRGTTSLTTIGRLTGFESHTRRHSDLGSRNSVEAAVYPYDTKSGAFSMGGDSGSIIVDAVGKFVALLTGGGGQITESSDITYGTLMCWLWDVIKAEFPDAKLYDDN